MDGGSQSQTVGLDPTWEHMENVFAGGTAAHPQHLRGCCPHTCACVFITCAGPQSQPHPSLGTRAYIRAEASPNTHITHETQPHLSSHPHWHTPHSTPSHSTPAHAPHRHSAGGSQERHDRTGGGARGAGAALRRAEVVRLWSAVAATLNAWAPELSACEVLVRSGDVRVWASLYGVPARPPAVDRRDARWEGAGVPVPRPRLRDALALWGRLCRGRVELLGEGEGEGEAAEAPRQG